MTVLLLSCGTTEKTITSTTDSTKITTQEISEEDQLGYILAVAAVGFIVLSLIIISNLVPPPGG